MVKLVRNPKTPVRVVITSEDSNEFNERPVILDKTFLCNYQDAAELKYTGDKYYSKITGTLYIDGDILESLGIVTSDFGVTDDGVLYITNSNIENGVLVYSPEEDGESDSIISGHVIIFGRRREIARGTKARNLDGSVNYTKLEVI